jgi:hypothetical protein
VLDIDEKLVKNNFQGSTCLNANRLIKILSKTYRPDANCCKCMVMFNEPIFFWVPLGAK